MKIKEVIKSITNNKYLLILSILVLALMFIWIIPIKNRNISIEIKTHDVEDGEHINLQITSVDKEKYVLTFVVCDNKATTKFDSTFMEIENIRVDDIKSVKRIDRLCGYAGDYENFKYKIFDINEITILDDESGYLSLDTIKNICTGFKNSFIVKVIFSIAMIVLYFIINVYVLLRKRYSKARCLTIVISFFLLLMFINYIQKNYTNFELSSGNNTKNSTIDISDGTIVKQNIKVIYDKSYILNLNFEKDENFSGDVVVEVLDSTEKNVIIKSIFSSSEIKAENSIETDKLATNQNYVLKVYAINNVNDSTIKLGYNSVGNEQDGQLLIDGVVNEGSLSYSIIYNKYNTMDLAIILLIIFYVIACTCILSDKANKVTIAVIVLVYMFVFVFSISKMLMYSKIVARTPDERMHISYVAYLEKNDKIIPEFDKMNQGNIIINEKDENELVFAGNTINYLGHPPLYYNIMRITNSIEVKDDIIIVKTERMRKFSILIAATALVLMFYIGFTRIKKIPWLHLLYATIVTSVPMMLYGASGISNDTLVLLTVNIYLLGAIRFCEKRRNILTYALIAIGITTSILTKVTAGLIVVVASVVLVCITLFKEKSLKEVFKKSFIVSLPIYIIALLYFSFIYYKYSTFQPGISLGGKEYLQSTNFYIDFNDRVFMNIFDYIDYYRRYFMNTWVGILSHVSLTKSQAFISMQTIALKSLWFLPLMLFCKNQRKSIKYSGAIISGYIAMLVVAAIQLNNGIKSFYSRGYTGGYQSRYYLCGIVIIALAIVGSFEKIHLDLCENNLEKNKEKVRTNIMAIVSVIFATLLFYEDFIYFLLNFKKYLI